MLKNHASKVVTMPIGRPSLKFKDQGDSSKAFLALIEEAEQSAQKKRESKKD
jgi:hypothetical protein